MQIIVTVLLVVLSGLVAAEGIYRWTDENGQVHYGGRPGGNNAQEVGVRKSPAAAKPAATESTSAQRKDRQQRLLESYERDRALRQEQKQRQVSERKKLRKGCQELQRNWRWLNHPGPIYLKGEDDKRDYLDEAERQRQKVKVRQQLDRYCR